jgi:hypothetical protein
LAVALFNLERELLNDFFEIARNENQAETQGENEDKDGMVFHNPQKKGLLH